MERAPVMNERAYVGRSGPLDWNPADWISRGHRTDGRRDRRRLAGMAGGAISALLLLWLLTPYAVAGEARRAATPSGDGVVEEISATDRNTAVVLLGNYRFVLDRRYFELMRPREAPWKTDGFWLEMHWPTLRFLEGDKNTPDSSTQKVWVFLHESPHRLSNQGIWEVSKNYVKLDSKRGLGRNVYSFDQTGLRLGREHFLVEGGDGISAVSCSVKAEFQVFIICRISDQIDNDVKFEIKIDRKNISDAWHVRRAIRCFIVSVSDVIAPGWEVCE